MCNRETNSCKNDDNFPRKGTFCKGRSFQWDFDFAVPQKKAGTKFLEVEKVTGEFTLKPLVKKPMEDYFSQNAKKKPTTKSRSSGNEQQTYTEKNPQKSKKKETEEEKLEREKYLKRYFELEKKIQNDERMSYLQHRRAEKEYILEQEKLADTWMTFITKRKESVDEKEKKENEKTSNRKGQRSEGRARTNGGPRYKKWTSRKGSFNKNTRESESPEMPNLGDLGEEISEKLTFFGVD